MLSAIIKHTIKDFKRGDPSAMRFVKTDIFREIMEAEHPSLERKKYNFKSKPKRKIFHSELYEE